MNQFEAKGAQSPPPPALSTFGMSDIGKMRNRNEDRFLLDDCHRTYAVADGLGGLPAGALASNIAIECLGSSIGTANNQDLDFEKIFQAINDLVVQEGKKVSREIGIGTTLTVVTCEDDKIYIGHVGDCVVYLFRDNVCHKLTNSHTMAEEIRSRMNPGDTSPIPDVYSHILTRCIGQEGKLLPEISSHEIRPMDRLLICSDGITKTLDEEELLAETRKAKSPEILVRRIIDIANERGGPDNSTAIGMFFE